jgi:4-hydroxy-tetrahydrodipicolinate synthase
MELQGVFAPVVTPFDKNEDINYPVLEKLIDFLIEKGITGFVPGGTTGEVYAYSDQERYDIFKFFKEYSNNRVHLMAGVNSGATRDVIKNAQLASKLGYDSLMVAVPPYSRPNQQELLSHFIDVVTSVEIPVLLYNFPWRAGTEVGMDVLDGLTNYKNVIGLKEASGDFSRMLEIKFRYGDRYQVVCGSDDQAFDYFAWGTKCWIGGAASCLPEQHVAVLNAALKGDLVKARQEMEKVMPTLKNMESGSYTQKVKYGCELRGLMVGAPRKPLLALAESERPAFEALFKKSIQA